MTWSRDRGVLCLPYLRTDTFSTATEWGNPQGHSGFSPDIKRNVHPSKKISQDPSKLTICLGNSYFCSTCSLPVVPTAPRKYSVVFKWEGTVSALFFLIVHHINHYSVTEHCLYLNYIQDAVKETVLETTCCKLWHFAFALLPHASFHSRWPLTAEWQRSLSVQWSLTRHLVAHSKCSGLNCLIGQLISICMVIHRRAL